MEKTIRVLNIDEEGRFGGPERRIVNVAEGIKSQNVETLVLLPLLDSEYFKDYATEKSVKFVEKDITRLSLEPKILFRYIYRFVYEVFIIVSVIRTYKPDLVHVNGAYQFKSILASRICNKKVVWHLNNQKANVLVKFVFDIFYYLFKINFIYASQKAYSYFLAKKRFKKSIMKEIHAPIDPEKYYFKKIRENPMPIIIGTIINFSPQKDLITLVEVVNKLRGKHSNFRVIVGGKRLDSQKKYIKKIDDLIRKYQLNDVFEFVGFVTDVPIFLRDLDIFINTSAWEGSPTAVWEALASGTPSVSTDVGSTRYYLEELGGGLICNVKDASCLSNQLSSLINSYNKRCSLAASGKKIAESYLSLSHCCKLHSEIYNEIIN